MNDDHNTVSDKLLAEYRIAAMQEEYDERYKGLPGKLDYVINGARYENADVAIEGDTIILISDILDNEGNKTYDYETGGIKQRRTLITLNPEAKGTIEINLSSFMMQSHEIS